MTEAALDTSTDYEVGKLHQIPLTDLNSDPNQPRKHIDEGSLKELASSISEHGVLQPILFRVGESGQLIIVAGERRYQASKLAGFKGIPGIRVDRDFTVIALIENMQRENLSALEEAEGLQRVIEVDRLEQKTLARLLGKAESTLSEMLKPTALPDNIKDKIRSDKKWTRQALLEIAREHDKKKQMQIFKSIAKKMDASGGVTRARKSKGQVETAQKLLDKVIASLRAMRDSEKWTDQDLEALKPRMCEIKAAIDELQPEF